MRPRRLFYGWYLAAGLGISTIVSYGVTQYLFGVLVVPVQRDLGVSRGALSGAFALGLVTWGVTGLAVGRAIDRFGARWLMTAGSLLGALCLLGLSRVQSLWQFYVLWSAGLGIAMALTLYPVTFTVVANFFARRRAHALLVVTLIGGLASPIYIPAAGWLVQHLGWRSAVQVLALTVLAVALPIHALLVRRRPEDLGTAPDGERQAPAAASGPGGIRLRTALRGRAFWLLTAAATMTSMASGVVLAHAVAYLIGRGYSPVTAASLVGLVGVASLPGRLVFNLVSDRFGAQPLLALCTAMQGAGVGLLLLAGPVAWVIAFVTVYGAAFGAVSPLRATVLADHFGRVAYGSITAFQNLPSAFASAAGPLVAGILYDRLGDYHAAFSLTAAAFLAAAILLVVTPRAPIAAAAEPPL